jgi:hypothetical protein
MCQALCVSPSKDVGDDLVSLSPMAFVRLQVRLVPGNGIGRFLKAIPSAKEVAGQAKAEGIPCETQTQLPQPLKDYLETGPRGAGVAVKRVLEPRTGVQFCRSAIFTSRTSVINAICQAIVCKSRSFRSKNQVSLSPMAFAKIPN